MVLPSPPHNVLCCSQDTSLLIPSLSWVLTHNVHCVAVEHALSHVRVIRLAVLCAVEDKMDGICTFFFNSFPHVYDYFPCTLWNGIIIFIINVLCAFAWTYMDLFIILISIALADRFRQLNRCMQSIKGKVSFFNKFSILYG